MSKVKRTSIEVASFEKAMKMFLTFDKRITELENKFQDLIDNLRIFMVDPEKEEEHE